jgi:hypothetical protein
MYHHRPRPLHSLDIADLIDGATDDRWPKWSTMCQLRLLQNPVLNAVRVTPGAGRAQLRAAIGVMAEATRTSTLMVRSDGGVETRAYYRGGNSFSLGEIESHAAQLLSAGRAVILLEPTNRFTNQLSVLLRMDRPAPGQPGTFTVEALGPGFDLGDLTRGGIQPQVRVSLDDVTWHRYDQPWWADMHVTRNMSPRAQHDRRQARLRGVAPHIRSMANLAFSYDEDPANVAATWLRRNGHLDLWRDTDPTLRIIRAIPSWFEAAFLIAAAHHNRNWRCLATSLSDLGDRVVYWDVVDGARKYAVLPERRIS